LLLAALGLELTLLLLLEAAFRLSINASKSSPPSDVLPLLFDALEVEEEVGAGAGVGAEYDVKAGVGSGIGLEVGAAKSSIKSSNSFRSTREDGGRCFLAVLVLLPLPRSSNRESKSSILAVV
jgi:hypothetical protein